ncbi:hypothetical protein O181_068509 [Austropuccinia psidii MF-1]|uniref:Glycerol transporter n=1 Tax=Austropuccinia psidii MF-1 TaxID=1389203 RepID=A0A9Q3EX03_9BASI|nr:hypothetical protein [Austropuccinia psidii MF-1]
MSIQSPRQLPQDFKAAQPATLPNTSHSISSSSSTFAPSKFKITSLTVTIPSSIHKTKMTQSHLTVNPTSKSHTESKSKSRWFSIEFLFYWAILAYSLKLIIQTTLNLSSDSHPNYSFYKHKLSSGWIFNQKIDNSDSQYRRFRLGLPQLILLLLTYLSLSKLSNHYIKLSRTHFQTIISSIILIALHGTSVLKIFLIVLINFYLIKALPVQFKSNQNHQNHSFLSIIFNPWILIWSINLLFLFSNDYFDGYRFRHISTHLSFLDDKKLRGLIPRWQIGFNISMLRLISFSFDYLWASQAGFANPSLNILESEIEKERSNQHRLEKDYNFQNYFNYIFYPPLYIAGPIITFNNFLSQMRKKPATITKNMIIGFTGRFLICFFTLEWILHYLYVVAIKDARAWKGNTPFELGIIGYWNLIIVWLKLLIPWRFFRLWALLDGVDPPENMVRCMSNNYSTLEFWRSWHRSYNLWIVRYLYIPLGGSKNMIPSTVIIFTFVALWHDLSFRLLTWGWLVSLFVLPEVIAKRLFAKSAYQHQWWFRHIKAMGGMLNVMTMMSANLVGFSLGIDGVKLMWHELLSSWEGLKVLLLILFVVFCAVQVMLEYREAETREGIHRRC